MAHIQGAAVISVPIPPHVHRRLKSVARRIGSTLAHVCREAVVDKTDALEKKYPDPKQKQRDEPGSRTVSALGQSPLGPSPAKAPGDVDEPVTPEPVVVATPAAPPDPLADIYLHHAQRLVECIEDITERRVRLEEALSAIRAECWLIEPEEDEMRRKLQDVVQRLRSEQRARGETPKPMTPSLEPLSSPSFAVSSLRFASALTGKPLRK